MRLLLDQNLSPTLVDRLSSAGHDVVHVRALGMSTATDAQIMDRAERDQRVVVSADTDFGELLAVTNQSRPSVVLLRRGCAARVRRQRSLLAGDQRSTRGSLLPTTAARSGPVTTCSRGATRWLATPMRTTRIRPRPPEQSTPGRAAGFRWRCVGSRCTSSRSVFSPVLVRPSR